MKKAQVWEFVDGKQSMMGEIILDDLGRLVATKGIAEKILNSFSDDGKRLLTKHDPEAFLDSLHRRYRSPYLRVTKTIDVDSS